MNCDRSRPSRVPGKLSSEVEETLIACVCAHYNIARSDLFAASGLHRHHVERWVLAKAYMLLGGDIAGAGRLIGRYGSTVKYGIARVESVDRILRDAETVAGRARHALHFPRLTGPDATAVIAYMGYALGGIQVNAVLTQRGLDVLRESDSIRESVLRNLTMQQAIQLRAALARNGA